MNRQDHELALIDDIASFTHDPLAFANYVFPWGKGELERYSEPKAWQRDVMNDIATHLKNPETRYMPLQIAIASGHGIGKSAEMGMILHWAMSTCEDCKIVVTANTDNQLRTKTWPEISKWQRLAINSHWFKPTATAIISNDKEHSSSWRADAIPWSEHNTEAFAGLHNEGKRIILIFDEASNIADKVWEVAEGALTDEDTEIIWLAFGNPTRNTGRFHDCFKKYRHRWITKQIDSRTVEGTNKEQIKKWVEDYGEDSDFVKVRVRGMFPSASNRQFISTVDVDAAFGRFIRPEQFNFAPTIISVDPAWTGADKFVIGMRQGLYFKVLGEYEYNDNDVQMANIIAQFETQYAADAVFVDMGYGTGIVSAGTSMGRNWMLVNFGGKSADAGCLNKRAEIWKLMRDWLKAGGVIPEDQELYNELIAPETVGRLDGKIQLESKDDMRKRVGFSPNKADALAITFAYPVTKNANAHYGQMASRARAEYDPFK